MSNNCYTFVYLETNVAFKVGQHHIRLRYALDVHQFMVVVEKRKKKRKDTHTHTHSATHDALIQIHPSSKSEQDWQDGYEEETGV